MKYYERNNYRMYLVFIFLMSQTHPDTCEKNYLILSDS